MTTSSTSWEKRGGKRLLAAGVLVILLFAVWALHDYRLPLPSRAHDLNRGTSWEHKTRVDPKGV